MPEAARSGVAEAPAEAVEGARKRFEASGPYILCVGLLNRHKRIVDAIRAIAMLPESAGRPLLVLAGPTNTGLIGAYVEEAQRLGVEDRLRFPGYISDDDLSALYTGAVAFVFPSIMEGFGLPPLEAMACGTPVIATDIPVLRESLAGAAMLVPAKSPGAIAENLATLIGDSDAAAQWSERGRARVKRFSWERAARETAEVLREVV